MITLIKNGKVVDGRSVTQRDVWIEDRILCAPKAEADCVVDAQGAYILPGFIDIHTHGAAGVHYGQDDDYTAALDFCARNGVTTILPTLGANPLDILLERIGRILREKEKGHPGAAIGGIHMEGPFISEKKKGAMDVPDLPCTEENFNALMDAGKDQIRVMTIAPERENACQVIALGRQRGVRMSIGHTYATYAEARAAIDAGAVGATHTFNAMRSYDHREPGVLGAVLTDPTITCEAICDTVHIAPATIRLIHRCKGTEGMILVSDSGSFAGATEGEYVINGKTRYVKDGVSRLANGTLSASCYTLRDDAEKLLAMGFSLCDVVAMGAENPAKAIGLDETVGSLDIGKDADIIFCDDRLNITGVYTKGVRYV